MPDKIVSDIWASYGLLGLGWALSLIVIPLLIRKVFALQADCESQLKDLAKEYNAAQMENVRVLAVLSERLKH